MTFPFAAVFASMAIAAQAFALEVDLAKIAGKTVKEVTAVLGKPTGEEKTKHGPKFIYKEGQVEVVFIDGKADWITVDPKGEVPYNERAIAFLGLKDAPPTFKNENVIRWEPLGQYLSVSVCPAGKSVDFFYVKCKTK